MKKELTNSSQDEIRNKFYNLKTLDDLANLLEIPKSKLYFYAYKANLDDHYKEFVIPKKTGGKRTIYAPSSPLKLIQKKLSQIFQAVYYVKVPVHGFVKEKSIKTNAKQHLDSGRKKYILNADIRNFFPTISMMRVERLLKATPYNLPTFVAQTIARLTCYMSFLPQGAPSSPIISNMICAKMDTRLRKLAKENKCIYTRYADDITISTNSPIFPSSIAIYDPAKNETIAGAEFQAAIEENGFKLNNKKVRLQNRYNRQEITGLIVNNKVNVPRKYVRQIRAMLHAWEKYGYEKAEKEYNEKYVKQINGRTYSFKKVILGKLNFLNHIKGTDQSIYIKLRNKLAQLDPDYASSLPAVKSDARFDFRILTEGKSDWKHLKAALNKFQENGVFHELSIDFVEQNGVGGDRDLLAHCRLATVPSLIEICIFDRDNVNIVRQVEENGSYKKWNNRVFSFAIPIPSHRTDTPDICLELYYKNADIVKSDSNGRRLFLSNEFHHASGKHLFVADINSTEHNKIRGNLTVIDTAVFNSENKNVALPKDDFASLVLNKVAPFDEMNITEFKLIFDLVKKVIIENIDSI